MKMLTFYDQRDQTLVIKNNYLLIQEKASLEIRHRENRDSRECDRIKAVLLDSSAAYAVLLPHKR